MQAIHILHVDETERSWPLVCAKVQEIKKESHPPNQVAQLSHVSKLEHWWSQSEICQSEQALEKCTTQATRGSENHSPRLNPLLG